jgi:uncharacterized protein YecE (DUF72 family)
VRLSFYSFPRYAVCAFTTILPTADLSSTIGQYHSSPKLYSKDRPVQNKRPRYPLGRTPNGFVFSVKVPQTITHDKVLVGCDAEIAEFLETMDILGEKLGPIIFQFPFFNRSIFPDRHAFTDRLVPFLKKLPADHKFGIEIRNRDWLNAEFADLSRHHQIALVLQDRSWMPNPQNFSSIRLRRPGRTSAGLATGSRSKHRR